MKSTLSRIFISIVLVSFGLSARAQSGSGAAPIEYLRPMKNSFSVGVRMIGGASVQFSGAVGVTPYTAAQLYEARDVKDQNTGAIIGYQYSNGAVYVDNEKMEDTVRPVYTTGPYKLGSEVPNGVGGRFYVLGATGTDGTPAVSESYLLHNPEYTRKWSYTSDDQLNDNRTQVGMSAYGSSSAGNVVNADSSASPGIELQMGRVIQRFKNFEWGVTVGFGFSEFNAKTRQSVGVKLDSVTDWYNIYNTGTDFKGTPTLGALPVTTGTTSNMSFPSFGKWNPNDPTTTDVDESSGINETTSPISAAPVPPSGSSKPRPDSTTVDGFWQIKGVYYVMRVGPMVRIPIGRRFSAYLSAGYMGAYMGSKFRYDERLNLPDTATVAITSPSLLDSRTNQKYLSGLYVDANLEWWLSTRTGFYAGAAMEKLSDYEQNFDGRKAHVKLSSGVGFRFGIITRF